MAMDPLAEFQSVTRAFRKDPRRMRLVMEGVKVLGQITARLDEKELRASSKKAGFELLVDAMTQESAQEFLSRHDGLAAARARGVALRREMLDQEGGVVGVEEVAARLGITRQAVSLRRAQNKLLAVNLGARRYLYPVWQFTQEGALPGLEDVLRALSRGGHSAWACMRFFLSKNYRMGEVRPLDLLRQGAVERVVRAASVYGEQGAT